MKNLFTHIANTLLIITLIPSVLAGMTVVPQNKSANTTDTHVIAEHNVVATETETQTETQPTLADASTQTDDDQPEVIPLCKACGLDLAKIIGGSVAVLGCYGTGYTYALGCQKLSTDPECGATVTPTCLICMGVAGAYVLCKVKAFAGHSWELIKLLGSKVVSRSAPGTKEHQS